MFGFNLFKTPKINIPDFDFTPDFVLLNQTVKDIQLEGSEIIKYISKLKNNSAKLESLYSIISESIIQINSEGVIIEANSYTSIIFEYNKEELINKNITMLMPNDNISNMHTKKLSENKNKKVKDFKIGPMVVTAKTKSGKIIDIELSISRLNLDDGDIIYIGIIKDISKLKETNLRYKMLCDSIEDGIFMIKNGIIIEANIAFAKMLGFEKTTDIIGINYFTLIEKINNFEISDEFYKENFKCNGKIISMEIKSKYVDINTIIGLAREII